MQVEHRSRQSRGFAASAGHVAQVRAVHAVKRDSRHARVPDPAARNGNSLEVTKRLRAERDGIALGGETAAADGDVAAGPRADAAVFGLEFLPVTEVAFDLVMPRTVLDHPRMRALLQRIRRRGFQREIESLPGYRAREAGGLIDKSGS